LRIKPFPNNQLGKYDVDIGYYKGTICTLMVNLFNRPTAPMTLVKTSFELFSDSLNSNFKYNSPVFIDEEKDIFSITLVGLEASMLVRASVVNQNYFIIEADVSKITIKDNNTMLKLNVTV